MFDVQYPPAKMQLSTFRIEPQESKATKMDYSELASGSQKADRKRIEKISSLLKMLRVVVKEAKNHWIRSHYGLTV